MFTWIKAQLKQVKISTIVIIILIVMLFFKGKYKLPDPKITKVTQIIDHFHDSVIYRTDFHTITLKPTIQQIPQELKPDSNDAVLRKQYDKLLELYASMNITKDTLKIDSLGYVSVLDTIQYNNIRNRQYNYRLNSKEKITTITIREPYHAVNQVYYGGELGWGTGQQNALNTAGVGLFFKSKSDNVLKLGADYNFTLKSPEIKIGYYRKIHL